MENLGKLGVIVDPTVRDGGRKVVSEGIVGAGEAEVEEGEVADNCGRGKKRAAVRSAATS